MLKALLILLLIVDLSLGKDILLKVDGLACAFCAWGLEKRLKELKGVERVNIHLNEGTVLIQLKEGVRLEEKVLRRIIKESGFKLREIKYLE